MANSIQEFFGLQRELDAFTARMAEFVGKQRTDVVTEGHRFAVELEELRSEQQALRQQIKTLEDKRRTVAANIELSVQELRTQQRKVDELARKQQGLAELHETLGKEIAALNDQIAQANGQLHKSSNNLETQNSKDSVEIVRFEQYLGLRIEVKSQDALKFVFHNMDAADADRQCWFDLDLGGASLRIVGSEPALAPGKVQALEDQFGREKDFVKLLKSVRSDLRAAM